jgi:hypothetical protein
MEPVVLLKIESLFARAVQETGLRIRHAGKDILTGPIVALLDDIAAPPANLGMIDLATGTIRLQWAVIATLPFMADAFASGAVPQKARGPVRATLDESGQLLEDGSGFDVNGTGQVSPGSFLSGASIPLHQNPVKGVGTGSVVKLGPALAAGQTVLCTFVPESSIMDVKLPKSLGGGTQRMNLTGGYLLVPVMTLERRARRKRSRR